MNELWDIVARIVAARGRQLVKYSYSEKVWRAIELNTGLVVVRAATGCGKTETGVAPFLLGLMKGRRSWLSLVYSLPTRSLASAMQRRLASTLRTLGVHWCTVTLDYGELLSIKPYLEGDIVVTTYDTLLYQFYGVIRPSYHVLLPASKITSSLLIMDEVQLLQDEFWYAMSLLPYHIRSLLQLGVQIIMLSATIPSVLLNDIERALKGISFKLRGLWENLSEIINSKDVASRGNLKVEQREEELPTGRRLTELIEELDLEARLPALIVVNKVEKAVRVYQELLKMRKEGKLTKATPLLLHSRLRAGHRNRIESLFEQQSLSQGSIDPESILLVATQVIEAGLDLDIRLLITELSPIDSLIQRLGRCGRKQDGHAIIFMDPEAGRGVYPQEPVLRTYELIKGMERELSLSVRSLKQAQSLLDEVYTEVLIEKLRSRAPSFLRKARSWIQKWPERIFSRLGHEPESPILRLGFELNCWLTPKSVQERLLKRNEVSVNLVDLRENIVRLSIRSTKDVPPAIIHHVDGHDVIIELELTSLENQTAKVRCNLHKPSDLRKILERKNLLLLNSSYYEYFDDNELGVVRPWK